MSVTLQGDLMKISKAKAINTCWTVQRSPGEKVTHNCVTSVTEDKHTPKDIAKESHTCTKRYSSFKNGRPKIEMSGLLLKSKVGPEFNEEQRRGKKKEKTAGGGQMGRVLIII